MRYRNDGSIWARPSGVGPVLLTAFMLAGLGACARTIPAPGYEQLAGRPVQAPDGSSQFFFQQTRFSPSREFNYRIDFGYRLGLADHWEYRAPLAFAWSPGEHRTLSLGAGLLGFGFRSGLDDDPAYLLPAVVSLGHRLDIGETLSLFSQGTLFRRFSTNDDVVDEFSAATVGTALAWSPSNWVSFALGISGRVGTNDNDDATFVMFLGPSSDGYAPIPNIAFHVLDSLDIGVGFQLNLDSDGDWIDGYSVTVDWH
ncbi:MAG: hypothetical protein AAFU77_02945 [Myxococcota bacterium]